MVKVEITLSKDGKYVGEVDGVKQPTDHFDYKKGETVTPYVRIKTPEKTIYVKEDKIVDGKWSGERDMSEKHINRGVTLTDEEKQTIEDLENQIQEIKNAAKLRAPVKPLKDKNESLKTKLSNLSPEERAKLIEELNNM
jgi:hypothetical protein